MRDKPVYILDVDPVGCGRLFDAVYKVAHSHPETGIGLDHVEGMEPPVHTFMAYGCGPGSTSRQKETLAILPVRMNMGGQEFMPFLGRGEDRRTRAITPEDACGPVLVVQGACHDLGTHHKDAPTVPGLEVLGCHIETEDKAGTGSGDVKGNGLGRIQLCLQPVCSGRAAGVRCNRCQNDQVQVPGGQSCHL